MCFSISAQLNKLELEKKTSAQFAPNVSFSPFYFKTAFENTSTPVITNAHKSTIAPMEWGLVPHWINNSEQANQIRRKTYNARLENIFDKISFKHYSQTNRCVIPVSGFFEWQQTGSQKIPWYIYPKSDSIFNLAGIWSVWIDSETGEHHSTFSIITVPANSLMAKIHNIKKRMPAILHSNDIDQWLSTTLDAENYSKILAPYDDSCMSSHTISPKASSTKSNRNIPEIILPYTHPNQQLELF